MFKIRKITAVIISTVILLAMIPAFSALADNVFTLYPANGSQVFDTQTITFKATAAGASNVAFRLDGVLLGTPAADGNTYTLAYNTSAMWRGEHVFTVTATVGGNEVEESAKFMFYTYSYVVADVDFNSPEDVNGTLIQTAAAISASDKGNGGAIGFSSSTDSALGYANASGCGTDGNGNYWLHAYFDQAAEEHASIRFLMDNKFFGKNVVGDGRGLSEGVVITEFDIRMNTAIPFGMPGAAGRNVDQNSTMSTSADYYLFMWDNVLGDTSRGEHFTPGQWGHVKFITDYVNHITSYYYNDVCVQYIEAGNTMGSYGYKEQGGSYGIQLEAWLHLHPEDIADYDLDNLLITYKPVNIMCNANLNDWYNGASHNPLPGFALKDFTSSDPAELIEKTTGDGDWTYRVRPRSDNSWLQINYSNTAAYDASKGVLHGSFDIMFEEYFDVGLCNGFGFYTSSVLFTSGGFVGDLTYDTNKWYHVDVIEDLNSEANNGTTYGMAYIYIDGVLCSADYLRYPILRDGYFGIMFHGKAADNNNTIWLDTLDIEYANETEILSAVAKDDALTLEISNALANVTASDINVDVDGAPATVTGVSQSGTTLSVTLDSALTHGSDVKATVKDTAKMGTIVPLSRDLKTNVPVVGFSEMSVSKAAGSATASVSNYSDGTLGEHFIFIASYDPVSNTLTGINCERITPANGVEQTNSATINDIASGDKVLSYLWTTNLAPVQKKSAE